MSENITVLSFAEQTAFWSKVKITPYCWEWTGAIKSNGYGIIRFRGETAHAHHLAYKCAKGEPVGNVCHTCDNRKCVNPDHLWDGTQKDNLRDMREKGRAQNYGSRHGMSKLTEEQVLEIRRRRDAGESNRSLAVCFGVTEGAICNMVKRKSWRHI